MVKKTLKEIANFFDMAVAIDSDGSVWMHPTMPTRSNSIWRSKGGNIYILDRYLVDNAESLRGSLTIPDAWEPPFKDGEILMGAIPNLKGRLAHWNKRKIAEHWRRPTEAEWKVLRGEE